MHIDAIERANDRVLITTAYFIPDREVLSYPIAAARTGGRRRARSTYERGG